jgi:hypothetical protein
MGAFAGVWAARGDLDKAERARADLLPNVGKQTKAAALADAGLSICPAQHYAQLAGVTTMKGRKAVSGGTRPQK